MLKVSLFMLPTVASVHTITDIFGVYAVIQYYLFGRCAIRLCCICCTAHQSPRLRLRQLSH